jgi:hypothetical protein
MKKSTLQCLGVEVELGGPDEGIIMSSGGASLMTSQARISVTIPRGVYKKFKLLAHDREMTVSALLLHLIKAELQR